VPRWKRLYPGSKWATAVLLTAGRYTLSPLALQIPKSYEVLLFSKGAACSWNLDPGITCGTVTLSAAGTYYGYNPTTSSFQPFTFTGCGGNENSTQRGLNKIISSISFNFCCCRFPHASSVSELLRRECRFCTRCVRL